MYGECFGGMFVGAGRSCGALGRPVGHKSGRCFPAGLALDSPREATNLRGYVRDSGLFG